MQPKKIESHVISCRGRYHTSLLFAPLPLLQRRPNCIQISHRNKEGGSLESRYPHIWCFVMTPTPSRSLQTPFFQGRCRCQTLDAPNYDVAAAASSFLLRAEVLKPDLICAFQYFSATLHNFTATDVSCCHCQSVKESKQRVTRATLHHLHNRRQAHHEKDIIDNMLAQFDADVSRCLFRLHQERSSVKTTISIINLDQ